MFDIANKHWTCHKHLKVTKLILVNASKASLTSLKTHSDLRLFRTDKLMYLWHLPVTTCNDARWYQLRWSFPAVESRSYCNTYSLGWCVNSIGMNKVNSSTQTRSFLILLYSPSVSLSIQRATVFRSFIIIQDATFS